MATRDFLKHTVSISEPIGSALGDEWYNPSTNKIYKRLAVNGTAVSYREIPAALTVQTSGTTLTTSTSVLNFSGYTASVDSSGIVTINPPTAGAGGSNTQIQFNNLGSLSGSSSLTWTTGTSTLGITGFLTTFALARSGNVNAASWTTTSPVFSSAAALLTDNTGSGTISIRAGHSLLSPNFASVSAVTITDAANLYVNGNVASTNTTITNNWAIYNAGNMRVTGTLVGDSNIQQTAGLYYDSISSAITASGTVQGDATALTTTINNITTVSLNTGVRLPAPTVGGTRMLIRNSGANILKIYPAVGGQINALGSNVALSLEVGALIEFVAMSTTQWYTTNATFA